MGVSIALVRALVETVMHHGVDGTALFEDAGLDTALLGDASARIPNRRFDRLLALALERCENPAFGLRMGEHISLAAFDIVGYLAYHADTVREGLGVFLRYFRIVCDLEPPELIERGEEAILVCRFPRTNDACDRARAEFCFARLAALARNAFGSHAVNGAGVAREVRFEHAAPEYVEEYTRVFGPMVRFEQPHDAVVIPRSTLDLPLLHGDPQLYRVLQEHAERRLRTLHEPDSVSARVQELVLEESNPIDCDMDGIARRLGMSARTLRRRLAQEGRSFGDVISEAQATVAKRLLREPSSSIQEVSFQMGFADASSFHRAFKRWTGLTPKQYLSTLASRG